MGCKVVSYREQLVAHSEHKSSLVLSIRMDAGCLCVVAGLGSEKRFVGGKKNAASRFV